MASMFLALLIVGIHLVPHRAVVYSTVFPLSEKGAAVVASSSEQSLTPEVPQALKAGDTPVSPVVMTSELLVRQTDETVSDTVVPTVPFYSQFYDISAPQWRKVGCGIASLAMLIEYYEPSVVSVDELLQEGIEADAFLNDAGWTHAGLIALSRKYGLTGATHDLSGSSMSTAFETLEVELEEGPVMASVHYTFDPKNTIPHLVVINGVSDGKVFYNDPSEKQGGGSISIAKFQSAWKKRYIDIRPVS